MTINRQLLRDAISNLEKQGFVAAGDPAMGGAPPADPAAMGGAPPADPAAMGGGDPLAALAPMIQQMVQQAVSAGGGGGGGGMAGGGIKPKIDVNVELLQIKKLLARIVDALGIQVPAAEMVATSDDLNQMASQQSGGAAGGSAAGGGALGSIQPMQPMKAAHAREDWDFGEVYGGQLAAVQQSQQSTALKAIAALRQRQDSV